MGGGSAGGPSAGRFAPSAFPPYPGMRPHRAELVARDGPARHRSARRRVATPEGREAFSGLPASRGVPHGRRVSADGDAARSASAGVPSQASDGEGDWIPVKHTTEIYGASIIRRSVEVNASELQNFIDSVSSTIFEQTDKKIITTVSPIEFELAVTMKKSGRGKINLLLIDAGGKYEKEYVSKIKFAVHDRKHYAAKQSIEDMLEFHKVLKG